MMLEEILLGMWDEEKAEELKDRLGVYVIGLDEETQGYFWEDLARLLVWTQDETVKRTSFMSQELYKN